MESEIKRLLFEIIYDKLNLKDIEEDFNNNKIPKKDIINKKNEKIISNYFFLRNDVNLDELTKEETIYLLSKMNQKSDTKELKDFLEQNMLRLLLPKTNEKYIYWDINDDEHLAPSDAIVIAFHTIEFLEGIDEVRNAYICEKLNYIQDVLGPQANIKVAVLKYNEVPTITTEI